MNQYYFVRLPKSKYYTSVNSIAYVDAAKNSCNRPSFYELFQYDLHNNTKNMLDLTVSLPLNLTLNPVSRLCLSNTERRLLHFHYKFLSVYKKNNFAFDIPWWEIKTKNFDGIQKEMEAFFNEF